MTTGTAVNSVSRLFGEGEGEAEGEADGPSPAGPPWSPLPTLVLEEDRDKSSSC